jgi:hypothetical protein
MLSVTAVEKTARWIFAVPALINLHLWPGSLFLGKGTTLPQSESNLVCGLLGYEDAGADSFEPMVRIYRTSRRHRPQDHNPRIHLRKQLISQSQEIGYWK